MNRWRNSVRGQIYTQLVKAEYVSHDPARPGDVLIVFRDDSGQIWARHQREFEDGRYESVDV